MPEHAHDWPMLSLFVIGGYWNETELGTTHIAGPSAVLYRAGAAHRNTIAAAGFEQIEIEFDPAWLGQVRLPEAPVSQWLGGCAGANARALAQACSEDIDEKRFRDIVRRFVERASRERECATPSWLDTIMRLLRNDTSLKVQDLAREVGLHPSWLGTAYKLAAGEGLPETAAQFRVEHAAHLLRETDQSGAAIAADARFCDQSHMDRTFRRLLGRLPSAVRDDRRHFRQDRISA